MHYYNYDAYACDYAVDFLKDFEDNFLLDCLSSNVSATLITQFMHDNSFAFPQHKNDSRECAIKTIAHLLDMDYDEDRGMFIGRFNMQRYERKRYDFECQEFEVQNSVSLSDIQTDSEIGHEILMSI